MTVPQPAPSRVRNPHRRRSENGAETSPVAGWIPHAGDSTSFGAWEDVKLGSGMHIGYWTTRITSTAARTLTACR